MFTLAFTHELGTDTSLYATLEMAEQAACVIIADWFNDVADLDGAARLAEHLNAGEYSQAVKFWNQMDHNETLLIQKVALVTEVPTPVRIVLDAD